MSTAGSPSTTLVNGAQGPGPSHGAQRPGQVHFQGPRPPDSELRPVRGITYALILALPFWIALAWLIRSLVWS
jgi:hypothetical protein